MSELAKTYEPASVEAQATAVWMAEKCFSADPSRPGEPFTIVIPPPNVTGALHLGHAINNTLQDILTRQHRMAGFNTLWVPGLDHAGIATQAVVEKQLKEQENKTRHDVGREGLVQRIWAWKEQYGSRIIEQLKRLGCSCDWDRTRFTLDDMCARAVRETFFKLFKDGLIYRGKRLVNWDVHLQTSISDDEIYHETVKTSLWHIRYPIEGTDKFMVVATTRPETMLGDTAVAVHSEDARWNWAIGKRVTLPLTDRNIPIIMDDILVDPKFGSGVVKVTPAHDPNDYAVWQRHQGKPDQIDLLNILNPDGTINSNGGKYSGMKRDAARKKVVEELTALGLMEKEEPYETQVGHSDRSKTPVEPYLSDQWFVKMAPLAEPALEVVRKDVIKFYPERHAQQYLAWLGEKRDWPISRQLWWGHRIPVWSSSNSREYNRLHGGQSVSDSELETNPDPYLVENLKGKIRFHYTFDKTTGTTVRFACVRPGSKDAEQALEATGYAQDPDVLDTWFSSALWPHSTLGWPDQTPELKKYYPTTVLLTGRDIITLWVARMVMTGLYNMGQVPFHHVAINPTILDGKGERMSKSKGNGVDPVDIIDTHGADALRFTLTTMATETQDARLPVKRDEKGRNTSDKFDIGRNFANKLWNVVRFALANLESINPQPIATTEWTPADKWILTRLARTIRETDAALASYRFDVYARASYDFIWRDLCDWYVELAKPNLKPDSPRKAQTANVLAAAIDGSLRLLHPMMPFITEVLWWQLNEIRPDRRLHGIYEPTTHARLILSQWPLATENMSFEKEEQLFVRIQAIVTELRNVRNNFKIEPKKRLEVIAISPGEQADELYGNKEIIEQLAACTLHIGGDPPASAVRTTAAGCELFVLGLTDPTVETERLSKRRDELARQITALRGRLRNPGYTDKAPAHLVEQTRTQLTEAETELAKLAEKS